MAIVSVNLTYTQEVFPFEGMSDVPRERSDVPRGELLATMQGVAIASGGVGDSTLVNLALSFPRNFSYVMVDFYLGIFGSTGGVVNTYENMATCNLNNSVAGTDRDYAMLSSPFSNGDQNFGSANSRMKTYSLDHFPNIVVLPPPKQGAGMTVSIFNPALDDQDYSVNSMVRFLIFDVSQTHHYQVNTPALVR